MENEARQIEDTNITSIEPIKPPAELKRAIVNHSTDLIDDSSKLIKKEVRLNGS